MLKHGCNRTPYFNIEHKIHLVSNDLLHDLFDVKAGNITYVFKYELIAHNFVIPTFVIVSQKGLYLLDLYPHERFSKGPVTAVISRRRNTY